MRLVSLFASAANNESKSAGVILPDVYEKVVSRNIVEALKPYAEPEANKLDYYAAIAAFYNANPSDFVIENVIPVV